LDREKHFDPEEISVLPVKIETYVDNIYLYSTIILKTQFNICYHLYITPTGVIII